MILDYNLINDYNFNDNFPGSSIYSILISKGYKAGETLRISLIIIGISLSVCAFFASPHRDSNSIMIIYFAFVMFEVAIGMYFPGKILSIITYDYH